MNRQARRAIFFDLDGVLAESECVTRQVFCKFASRFERPAADAAFATLAGPPAPILVAKAKREWALPHRFDELMRLYDSLIEAAMLEVGPAAAALPTFEAAARNGWKLGIVTSHATQHSRAWLARNGLAPLIDVLVGGDDVCLGKPEPEPYLVALARSGSPREAAIAVEASLAGARSALAAGLRTFGVAPEGGKPLAWPEPIRLVATLDELMPELTRQRVRGANRRARSREGALT